MILRVPCCANTTSAHQRSLDHNDRCKQMNSVHDLLADDLGFETVLPAAARSRAAAPPLQVLMPGERRPDVEAVNAQMRFRFRDLRALPPEASPERKDTLRDIAKKTLSVDAQSAKCPARLRDLRALPRDGSPNLKITDASSHASPAGPSAAPLRGSDADLCLPNQVEIDAWEGIQSSPRRSRRGGRSNTGTSRALAQCAGAAGEPGVNKEGEERRSRRATAAAWRVQAPCDVSVQPARESPWPWRAYRRSGRFINGGRSASAAGVSAAGNCQAHHGGNSPAPTRNCGRHCQCGKTRSKNGEQKRRAMRPGTAGSSSTVHKDTPRDREATECWFVRHLLFRPPSLAVLQHSESLNRLGLVPHARLSRLRAAPRADRSVRRRAPRVDRSVRRRVMQDISFFLFL